MDAQTVTSGKGQNQLQVPCKQAQNVLNRMQHKLKCCSHISHWKVIGKQQSIQMQPLLTGKKWRCSCKVKMYHKQIKSNHVITSSKYKQLIRSLEKTNQCLVCDTHDQRPTWQCIRASCNLCVGQVYTQQHQHISLHLLPETVITKSSSSSTSLIQLSTFKVLYYLQLFTIFHSCRSNNLLKLNKAIDSHRFLSFCTSVKGGN